MIILCNSKGHPSEPHFHATDGGFVPTYKGYHDQLFYSNGGERVPEVPFPSFIQITCDECGLLMAKGTPVLYNDMHELVHPYDCKKAAMEPNSQYLQCNIPTHPMLVHHHTMDGRAVRPEGSNFAGLPKYARPTTQKEEIVRPEDHPAVDTRTFAEAAAEAGDVLLRWGLAQVRRQNGLTVEQVAERMGWNAEDVVREFESADSDPGLSSLRRYAMAVGGLIRREVMLQIPEPVEEVQ